MNKRKHSIRLFSQVWRWLRQPERRWPLRWQLMLSYLPLIFVPALLIGLVTSRLTEQGLTLLITKGAESHAWEQATQFATYYEEHGSWDGVSELFVIPPRPPWLPFITPVDKLDSEDDNARRIRLIQFFSPEQILITDMNGVIIASNRNNGLGQALSSTALSHGAPIMVRDKQIGWLVIGAALGLLDQQQRQMLDAVNGALAASGIVAIILAGGFGMLLSWQITRPAQQLMVGVRRLAAGQWSEPLKVETRNEFGDLTQAFNTMASEVTRQQQLRRQMVADVAHDLRTPLSAILLEIEAIEAGLQSPAEATVSLREEVTWLQRLVDDLRTLSLMDADQIRLQPQPTPLSAFVSGVYDFWQAMADEQGHHFCCEARPDLPVVCIDPGRVRQVLGNLIDNALKHTPLGGTIRLRAGVQGDQAVIEVCDNGRGIPPEDLPFIFDRFYRVDKSRQHDSSSGGSGLGLSIAQRLVELHRGQIEAHSVVGQGSTFTVRLPLN